MSSRSGFEALDPCVHCGFCLPACPTFLATGDESDSPRGRIVLMRALERGEIDPLDPALNEHLDACLGCRGCEPVCPSGVGYGRGLEAARELLVRRRGLPPLARLVLATFRHAAVWRPLFTAARWLRATGIPAALTGESWLGFPMGMLAASQVAERRDRGTPDRRNQERSVENGAAHPGAAPTFRRTAVLFRGCVMDTLFSHVHDATKRTLEVNGYRVLEAPGQVCCGALHEHAGDRPGAEALARANLAAFAREADFLVVNSAGCGALLKDYGRLLGTDEARTLGSKVRDVSELLADAGPRRGAYLGLTVAYDAPCHLQHAQRVEAPPLTILRAIPGLDLRLLPGSDRCCGSAGIYSLLQPALSREILRDKIATVVAAIPQPQIVATGNPGCLMQIGAGLRAAGLDIAVAHPVELLDESYRRAGIYEKGLGT